MYAFYELEEYMEAYGLKDYRTKEASAMKQQTKIHKLLKALTNMRGEIESELESAALDNDTRYEKQILVEGLFKSWAMLHRAYEISYGEEL